jgi:nucleoside-diphosphate-sugar epimerase
MRVFVAGSSGAIGRPLIAALARRGHAVVALTRVESKLEALRKAGAEPVVGDVFDAAGLARAVAAAAPDAVVHELTAIPPRIDPRHVERELAATNRLRDEGTRNLIAAAAAVKSVRRFVAQSVAFAYEPGPALRVESDPFVRDPPAGFGPVIAALRSLESQVGALDHEDVRGVVLRYGYFYGPGTAYARGGSFHDDVLHRRIPIPGAGSGVFSFIEVEDAADATCAALERGSGTFNVVDDEPAPLKEWLPEYARRIGAKPPWHVPGLLARLAAGPYGDYLLLKQPGASNAKARRELQWSPRRASWRQGFAELFAA